MYIYTILHKIFAEDTVARLDCSLHEDEVVKYFCENCSSCICVVCAFDKHKVSYICITTSTLTISNMACICYIFVQLTSFT